MMDKVSKTFKVLRVSNDVPLIQATHNLPTTTTTTTTTATTATTATTTTTTTTTTTATTTATTMTMGTREGQSGRAPHREAQRMALCRYVSKSNLTSTIALS